MEVYEGIIEQTDIFKNSPCNKNCCITFAILKTNRKSYITGWLTNEQLEQLEKLGIFLGSYCTIEFGDVSNFRVTFE